MSLDYIDKEFTFYMTIFILGWGILITYFGIVIFGAIFQDDTSPDNLSKKNETIVRSHEKQEIDRHTRCLDTMICQVPEDRRNKTFNFNLALNRSEICYEFETDPCALGEYVEDVIDTYPEDLEEHMDWTPLKYDPKIRFIYNDSVTEIVCTKTYRERPEDYCK